MSLDDGISCSVPLFGTHIAETVQTVKEWMRDRGMTEDEMAASVVEGLGGNVVVARGLFRDVSLTKEQVDCLTKKANDRETHKHDWTFSGITWVPWNRCCGLQMLMMHGRIPRRGPFSARKKPHQKVVACRRCGYLKSY